MLESSLGLRIEIVEPDAGLRSELARALSRLGFEVATAVRVEPPARQGEGVRYALRVIDLAADGASGWLADPAAAGRCVFLAGEAVRTPSLAARIGRDLDVLFKPFSIQALEARLLRRLEALRAPERLRSDPLLQTRDPRLARIFERGFEIARRDCPINLEGELGTGRRAFARALHAASTRSGEGLRVLESSSLAAETGEGLEHELRRRVAQAAEGTLLVVEPESLPFRAQRALQSALRGEAEEGTPRCITISRAPLDESAREGRLSAELFYRLSGATFRLPPLRERREDQLAVCTSIARRVARELGLESPVVEPALIERLARDGFPGNRLGLESRLRSALIRAEASSDLESLLFEPARTSVAPVEPPPSLDLKTLERETIVRALGHANGNRTHASAALGISVRTLRNKIREYGLR
jgi:two-component system response regulator FlrC